MVLEEPYPAMPEPHTNFVLGLCSRRVLTKIALEIGLSNASQTIGYSEMCIRDSSSKH